MSRQHPIRLGAALAALALLSSTPALAGQWVSGSYANIWGIRSYQAWIPTGYTAGTRVPAVVVLHGCTSDANHMARVSRYNAIADREKFIAIYPQQSALANPIKCWNFPYPQNQVRGTGEPSIIIGILNRIKASYSIDNSRVYVTGISAGGAMTATLAACYSDVFAAGMIHSGAMYKAAVGPISASVAMLAGSVFNPDDTGRDAWQCSGSPRRLIPMMVFHGTEDGTVNPINGDQAVQQFLQTNDLGDDGADNNTVANVATSTTNGMVPNGRTYSVRNYQYAGKLVGVKYTVNGMGHAWAGGLPGEQYSDPLAPDASELSWSFFKNHRR